MSAKIISLTKQAVMRVKQIMAQANNKNAIALRISLEKGGCSGMKYKMEYTDKQNQSDDVVEQDGVKVFIDRSALMFLLGTVMDYKQDVFSSGFDFINPNQTSSCGCGASVMLKPSSVLLETL